jgi:hypothetical protein
MFLDRFPAEVGDHNKPGRPLESNSHRDRSPKKPHRDESPEQPRLQSTTSSDLDKTVKSLPTSLPLYDDSDSLDGSTRDTTSRGTFSWNPGRRQKRAQEEFDWKRPLQLKKKSPRSRGRKKLQRQKKTLQLSPTRHSLPTKTMRDVLSHGKHLDTLDSSPQRRLLCPDTSVSTTSIDANDNTLDILDSALSIFQQSSGDSTGV